MRDRGTERGDRGRESETQELSFDHQSEARVKSIQTMDQYHTRCL